MLVNDTNDALGGGGSLAAQLRDLAVSGISRYVDGALSKKYPLTSGEQLQTLDASGDRRALANPATPTTLTETLGGFLTNPSVQLVGIAIAGSLALYLIFRK